MHATTDVGASRHRARLSLLLTVAMLLTLVTALPGSADLSGSNFQSGDGELTSDEEGEIDWNDLIDGVGTPVADRPGEFAFDRSSDGERLNYEVSFDHTNDSNDIVYRGGRNDAKHDVDCPRLRTKKEQNKSDFARFGIAHEVIDGAPIVYLHWVRIEQNSTSASGHASFELNQGQESCGGSEAEAQMVRRTAGDVLFIYDFEGGPGQVPTIETHRWIDADGRKALSDEPSAFGAGDCEVASSLPCWSTGSGDLVGTAADARVNDASIGEVRDDLTDSELGVVTFGEAGIDFDAAGITGDDCIGFGLARVSSRSSGNSFEADMKDWVEPAEVNIDSCGSITIEKETDPEGVTDRFDFTIEDGDGPLTHAALDPDGDDGEFDLGDGDDITFDGLNAGTYTVEELDPGPDYALTDLECTSSRGADIDVDVDVAARTVDIHLVELEDVTCTFTNTLQIASILIVKHDHLSELLAGATFTLTELDGDGDPIGSAIAADVADDPDGIHCFDGLQRGTDYDVTETPPTGYTSSIDPIEGLVIEATNLDTCAERLAALAELSGDPSLTDVVDAVAADEVIQNDPEPGRVIFDKTDDADNPIAGVQFALHEASSTDGAYTIGDVIPDTTCTTDAAGVCREDGVTGVDRPSFDQLDPGDYCVAEIDGTRPDAYGPAEDDPHCFTVALGVDGGDTVTGITVVNPRLHRIAVIVCHMGDDTLSPSEVTMGDATIITPGDAAFADLCDAEADPGLEFFEGLGHGDADLTVDVSSEEGGGHLD